jgi:small subunit ribosomal protein S15
MKTVQKHDSDTGSASVQVALLTKQIGELTAHLKKHTKDKHSRRGLLQMVANRRSHLKYLEKSDKKEYNKVVKNLGLKK